MGSRTNGLHEDRSSIVEVATYALTGTFVLFFIARQVMKTIVFRKFALDDLLIFLATALAVGLSVTTLLLTSKGFGALSFLSVERANAIMKVYYASELLYISSLCFSKLSIVVLFYNVVVLRTHRMFVLSFGICIFMWSLASLAAVAFQCSLPRPWEMMTLRCFNTRMFWVVYCALDMSTELFIVMLSVDLVAHLRVRTSRKVTVVACFAPRLSIAAAALVRAVFLYQVTPHGDPEYDLWTSTICTQVHVCASICTACIPYMVPFFKSLQSNIWRSYSRTSWAGRSRPSQPLDRSPNRLRKREANIRFESSFNNLIKEPERVSIISPRIPSPGPISPFLPPHISTHRMPLVTTEITESRQARTISVARTLYDSDSDEVFDMVSLQAAMCFAPSPIEPPAQARLSSAAMMDAPEPFEYLALLGNPDSSNSSSCYSSRASSPTRSVTNPKFSLFSHDATSYTPLRSTSYPASLSAAHGITDDLASAGDVVTRVASQQTPTNSATSYIFDDFAHPARSASSRSHPKSSTTPRLHAHPPTLMPTLTSSHS